MATESNNRIGETYTAIRGGLLGYIRSRLDASSEDAPTSSNYSCNSFLYNRL
jgi:hypothetical protein